MSTSVHVGDAGTVIEVTFRDDSTGEAVDLSAAQTLSLTLKPPRGLGVTRSLDVVGDPTMGTARYVSVAEDFARAGPYQAQGRMVSAAGDWVSNVVPITVGPRL